MCHDSITAAVGRAPSQDNRLKPWLRCSPVIPRDLATRFFSLSCHRHLLLSRIITVFGSQSICEDQVGMLDSELRQGALLFYAAREPDALLTNFGIILQSRLSYGLLMTSFREIKASVLK